jgi:hypothetical protein
MKTTHARFASAAAFSLVEVALALGVAGFCLVPLVGLLPLGFTSNQAAFSQTTAASIITHVLTDLRATPATLPPGGATTSAEYSIPIPADASGATPSPATLYFGSSVQQFSFALQPGTSRFRLTVNFLPPAGGRTSTWVTLLVTWPAPINPAGSGGGILGRVQVFAALNRN